jgi:hypothetical protein
MILAISGVVLTVLALLPGAAAGGPSLTVTRTDDPLPDGCKPADCSLREALIDANQAFGHDTIDLAAGTYVLDLAGAGEDMSAVGDLDVNDDTTIVGSSAGQTAVDAGGIDRVFDIGANATEEVITVEIRDLTIRGGDAGAEDGGGIRVGDSSGTMLILRDAVVQNNTAAEGGGVSTCCGSGAEITDVAVISNVATTGGSFAGGGGIFHCCSESPYEMTRVEILNNVSSTDGGGAFFCCSSVATLSDVTISGNVTTSIGGGLFHCCNGEEEEMSLFSVTVDGNTSGTEGGGVYNCCAGTILMFTNVTISGNSSGTKGGGYHNEHSESALSRFTNATVYGNSAPMGAGIYNGDDDDVTIINTIVAANAGGGGDCAGRAVGLLGNNLDSDATCTGAIGFDPMLGPLADNGGFTQTHELLPGSLAIDFGSAAFCPATDQRGVPRPQGPQCDVGAFELEAAGPTPTPTPTPGVGQQLEWGDDDCDGDVDSVDGLKNLQDVVGFDYAQTAPCFELGETVDVTPAGATQRVFGDVDCDGDVDSVDALGILRSIAALPVNQEAGCPEIGDEVLVGT